MTIAIRYWLFDIRVFSPCSSRLESETLQLLAGMDHSAVVDTRRRQKDLTASCYIDVCLAAGHCDVDIGARRSIL